MNVTKANAVKIACVLLTALIVLFVIVFAIIRENSFSQCLRANGYDPHYYRLIERDVDENGDEVKIIKTTGYTKALLYLQKNKYGFWHIEETAASAGNEETTLLFSKQNERHKYISGSGANKIISIPNNELPLGVVFNAVQDGGDYTVVFVWYGDRGYMDGFDVREYK